MRGQLHGEPAARRQGQIVTVMATTMPFRRKADRRSSPRQRMFGDFSPKRGDMVFAKTGVLRGIMVSNDYCALLRKFSAAQSMRTGPDIRNLSTSALFNDLKLSNPEGMSCNNCELVYFKLLIWKEK
jgi:hypothetical protein